MQDALSKHKYRDLVAYETNEVVHKLLEATVRMQISSSAHLSEQELRIKQRMISERCPTLFSPLESKIFLG